MTAEHLTTGQAGEDAAVALLRKKGYAVLERNWRAGGLELDIICRDRDELVFVEVRTRSLGGLAQARETLTRSKQAKLVQAACRYLSASGQWDQPCRFDFVSVVKKGPELQLEHERHVIDLSQALGGGDAAWQPW